MKFAPVLVVDDDRAYERPAFVPDDWTVEQMLAAFRAAAAASDDADWLAPALDTVDGVAFFPVSWINGTAYIAVYADWTFSDDDADAFPSPDSASHP